MDAMFQRILSAEPKAKETAEPLFGSLIRIKPSMFSGAVSMVILVVVFLELSSHHLNHYAADTKFSKNIKAIENELMIVGCTAFCFKILISNTSFLEYDWFHALEFADILVPIFSIMHCLLGVTLVTLSVWAARSWTINIRRHLHEVIGNYYESQQNVLGFMTSAKGALEIRVYQAIFCEAFRIPSNKFGFDKYLEYVLDEFICDVINIHLHNWVIIIALLMLYIARDSSLDILFAGKCHSFNHATTDDHAAIDDHPTDDHRRLSAAGVPIEYLECLENQQLLNFFCLGCILCCLMAIVAYVSNYYLKALIRTQGLKSHKEYPKFLDERELRSKNDPISSIWSGGEQRGGQSHANESAQNQIRNALSVAKKRKEEAEERLWYLYDVAAIMYYDFSDGVMETLGYFCWCCCRREESVHVDYESLANQGWDMFVVRSYGDAESSKRARSASSSDADSSRGRVSSGDAAETAPGRGRTHSTDIQKAEDKKGNSSPRSSTIASPVDPGRHHSHDSDAGAHRKSPKKRVSAVQNRRTKKRIMADLMAKVKLIETELANKESNNDGNISPRSISPRGPLLGEAGDGSPRIESMSNLTVLLKAKKKFMSVKHRMDKEILEQDFAKVFLFSSPEIYFTTVKLFMMFISLYFSLFFANFVAYDGGKPVWKLLSFAVGMMCSALYVYISKKCVLLMALWQVNYEAMVNTLNDEEDGRRLFRDIRDKLVYKVQKLGPDPRVELKNLFDKIDDNGSSTLSRKEFKLFLNSLGVHFNNRKWNYIFGEVDLNYDDEITLNEFILFLFPEDKAAKDEELLRMHLLKDRILQQSNKGAVSTKQDGSAERIAELSPALSFSARGGGVFEVERAISTTEGLMRDDESNNERSANRAQEDEQPRSLAVEEKPRSRNVSRGVDEIPISSYDRSQGIADDPPHSLTSSRSAEGIPPDVHERKQEKYEPEYNNGSVDNDSPRRSVEESADDDARAKFAESMGIIYTAHRRHQSSDDMSCITEQMPASFQSGKRFARDDDEISELGDEEGDN